jgi:predicted RNA binding protein YcfA (HicA-like mRNA interferase family)
MANQVTVADAERALKRLGFVEAAGKKTSHRQFTRGGLKITLPGKGPTDLTKKHVAIIRRQLATAGLDFMAALT